MYTLKEIQNYLSKPFDANNPLQELIEVLNITLALVSSPDNDFSWSSWKGCEDAIDEINGIIADLKNGFIHNRMQVAILFAATGPLQDVSLSSGWSNLYLLLAIRFDELAGLLWP